MKFKLVAYSLLLPVLAYAENTIMEIIALQHRPASEIQALIAPLLENGDRVSDNGFQLIVKTTPGRLENIKALVQQLDTQQHNLIVSVLQNSSLSADELNAQESIRLSPQTIQFQGMNADTRELRRQQTTQSLRTLEGQAAIIKTGKIRPIQNIGVYGSINANQTTANQFVPGNTQFIEIDSGFSVTPRLNGEQISIEIAPWSEQFQAGNQIETQGLRTSVNTKLGVWVEIAGIDSTSTQTGNGINTFNQGAIKKNQRILLKIDKAD